jgi:hypothetical protein
VRRLARSGKSGTQEDRKVRIDPVLTTLAVTAVAIGAIVLAQNRQQKAPVLSVKPTNPHAAHVGSAPKQKKPERKLAYYTGRNLSDGLFSRPVPPPPGKPAPPPPEPPPSPVAEYAYTGTVTVGDQIMALIENTRTKIGSYLKPGDLFQGGVVTQVTGQQVVLKIGSAFHTITRNDNYSFTPFSKSAGFLANAGKPGQPNPGQPDGQPNNGGEGAPPPGMNDGAVDMAVINQRGAVLEALQQNTRTITEEVAAPMTGPGPVNEKE